MQNSKKDSDVACFAENKEKDLFSQVLYIVRNQLLLVPTLPLALTRLALIQPFLPSLLTVT